ncbi:MAG: FeoB-associated Cys-rich membrane protein [Clostridia bacterium]|nr:FeoB-associated Cys-rich membrane protein [Clostridia bacterium]
MATVIISVIIAALVVAIIIKEIKNRKAGKCSCGCGSCAFKDKCSKN